MSGTGIGGAWLLGLVFAAVTVLWARGSPKSGVAEDIRTLVKQLGGAGKSDPAQARRRLIEIGPAALAALREAAARRDDPMGKAARGIIEEIARQVQKRLETRLAKIKARSAIVYPIRDRALARVFPANLFFAVRFPQYPVLVRARAPLRPQNIFVVDRDGQLDHVYDFHGLEEFFRQNVGRIFKESAAKNAARAWLALSSALIQDGYYQFAVPVEELKVGPAATGVRARGKAVIKPEKGNGGYIEVALSFDLDGTLEEVREVKKPIKGKRPKGK